MEACTFNLINAHEGGRNLVYACQAEGREAAILRIAFLPDRSRADILAEAEYVRYLHDHGGSVANVLSSVNGNLTEEITHDNHTYHVCLFEKVKGKRFIENNYRYRDGVPIAEYYYNCGKTIGKLHQLSKQYTPACRRYSFLEKYNAEYIREIIPDSLPVLKRKLVQLIETLSELDKGRDTYGMIHFDYNDGNYSIDFDTGRITVYDFDNSCFCWYMFDLASIWKSGVGWIRFEPDVEKRKQFMDDYFNLVIEGYKSETAIDDSALEQLPLFIQAAYMENIIDAFEVARNNGEEVEYDERLMYLVKCAEEEIPYMGFYHEIYSCEAPFEYKTRIGG